MQRGGQGFSDPGSRGPLETVKATRRCLAGVGRAIRGSRRQPGRARRPARTSERLCAPNRDTREHPTGDAGGRQSSGSGVVGLHADRHAEPLGDGHVELLLAVVGQPHERSARRHGGLDASLSAHDHRGGDAGHNDVVGEHTTDAHLLVFEVGHGVRTGSDEHLGPRCPGAHNQRTQKRLVHAGGCDVEDVLIAGQEGLDLVGYGHVEFCEQRPCEPERRRPTSPKRTSRRPLFDGGG